MKGAVMDIVANHFRPEFINRIDETVVFHPLGKREVAHIATIQIKHLAERLAEKEIGLNVQVSAMELLSDLGYDPVYGARPLKRAIIQQVENPLANQILSGAFIGGDEIKVHVAEDKLTFNK